MTTLGEISKLIRSKNAGAWLLTVDVMLADPATFRHVVSTGVLDRQRISELFQVPAEDVQIYEYAPGNAIKISFPRHVPNGHPLDSDIFGGQQFAPLVDLEIPDPEDQALGQGA